MGAVPNECAQVTLIDLISPLLSSELGPDPWWRSKSRRNCATSSGVGKQRTPPWEILTHEDPREADTSALGTVAFALVEESCVLEEPYLRVDRHPNGALVTRKGFLPKSEPGDVRAQWLTQTTEDVGRQPYDRVPLPKASLIDQAKRRGYKVHDTGVSDQALVGVGRSISVE